MTFGTKYWCPEVILTFYNKKYPLIDYLCIEFEKIPHHYNEHKAPALITELAVILWMTLYVTSIISQKIKEQDPNKKLNNAIAY